MTTERQKRAVVFCEDVFDIKFTGDINNQQEVSDFLLIYMSEAATFASEIANEYRAYMFEKL